MAEQLAAIPETETSDNGCCQMGAYGKGLYVANLQQIKETWSAAILKTREAERIAACRGQGFQIVQSPEFGKSAMDVIKRESQSAMRDGQTLANMAECKEVAKLAFLAIQSECAAGLSASQALCKTAQEELQRKRGQLTTACQGWKPLFVPGPARRAAREVLNAASKCSEARLGEATIKAEIRAFRPF